MNKNLSTTVSGGGGGTSGTGGSTVVNVSQNSKLLQDRLHELITRVSNTVEHVRNWQSNGDEASINAERTKLIAYIHEIIKSIQKVENHIKNDPITKTKLSNCSIPYDLLDLLDQHELNPDCFSRGLLREAMNQLSGLKRRKKALEMLGAAVQTGLQQYEIEQENKQQQLKQPPMVTTSSSPTSNKVVNPLDNMKRERDNTELKTLKEEEGEVTNAEEKIPSILDATESASKKQKIM